MNEAFRIAAEGTPLPVIDQSAEEFGMPMGPVELADSVGLDVALSVAKILGTSDDELSDLKAMVDAGQTGRKSGQGFYQWQDGKAVKPPVGSDAAPTNLADRLILPMVNEAARCLAEGVVENSDLLKRTESISRLIKLHGNISGTNRRTYITNNRR